jgi:transcriptional pleiotropic regulator of transition state genes
MAKKTDTGIIRSIDRIGRLVIPIELRRELGLNTGEPVQMYVENNRVIVEKYKKRCFICGKSASSYNVIHGKKICNECKAELNGVEYTEEVLDDEEETFA